MSPYFSIIIPTYNRALLIAKTIESVLSQKFSDFEVIVVDDGSKDNTEEIVNQFSDKRIRYFKKENGERGAARNYGRIRATGEYINFFDSDDLMYPNHLDSARNFIVKKNSPEFFHLGYDFKTPDGRVTKKVDNLNEKTLQTALFDNFLSCNGVFVRNDVASKHPFEENRTLSSAEDWELWIRLMSRFPLHFSNEITTSVVNHDERSIATIASDKIIQRDLFLINSLKNDDRVMEYFGRAFNRFIAERYSFFMLCKANEKLKNEVVNWARKAFVVYPLIILSKRFLVSLRKVIVS